MNDAVRLEVDWVEDGYGYCKLISAFIQSWLFYSASSEITTHLCLCRSLPFHPFPDTRHCHVRRVAEIDIAAAAAAGVAAAEPTRPCVMAAHQDLAEEPNSVEVEGRPSEVEGAAMLLGSLEVVEVVGSDRSRRPRLEAVGDMAGMPAVSDSSEGAAAVVAVGASVPDRDSRVLSQGCAGRYRAEEVVVYPSRRGPRLFLDPDRAILILICNASGNLTPTSIWIGCNP